MIVIVTGDGGETPAGARQILTTPEEARPPMAQPVQHSVPERVIYAVTHLIAASVITAVALAGVASELLSPDQILPPQIQGLLLAAPIVAWSTYRSRRAEERVVESVAELKELVSQRLTSAGEAEAYVDGLMRRDPPDRPLRVVQ